MSGLALSCYESTLCCFFNTTSLVSRKFWCLSVNLVQNDLKVFVAVRGKETKRERERESWTALTKVYLFGVSLQPPVSHLSFPQSFSCKVFFPQLFANNCRNKPNQQTCDCVEHLWLVTIATRL